MADKKISELTGAGTLTGTEEVPIVQGGVTVKATTQDIADLGGGGSFDPSVDEVGTITPTNAPIDTGQTVEEGFSNAQGQIDELPNVVSLQVMTENGNTEVFTDDTALVFNLSYNDTSPSLKRSDFSQSFSGIGINSRALDGKQSEVNSADGELEIRKTMPSTEFTSISIDDPVANTNWKVPAKADAGDYEFASTSDLADIIFDLEAVLENEILESGLVWQVPNIDGSYGTGVGSQYLRLLNAPTVQNTSTSGTFGLSCGVLTTTASAGGIAFIRRNDALNLALYTNVESVRDFTVDSAITSGCRYFTGWSKNFQFSAPTNIEPDLQTECILVAKLSTSNNLQILHNDNTGTCTAIALGANFPANSNLYKYRVILQRISATNYYIQVIRKTLSDGTLLLSSVYNLTTDLPTAGGSPLQQIHFITNNADATDMRLGDYGLIVKKISI
jgi:hypothetical protein